ncbi:rhodanese-like domain-containing protein [Mucilaginibacter sp. P25]|uniref:Rhodanese-like domain-containing protein n=2 Tax=Mucilaginibacter TaxID=423349 RepID=A0AAE6JE75_9SPHI|nr:MULTISPECIES: rhodanese-like domain-containing protein [Mucilaginibacter]QEM03973.1 rhodanese-like domain-containing protein [Mucilaginibacter rubeus]QEM16582.1 rhodanese-like domain-containing protein [Mucilaginibacter gossypii]QTE40644.1 rhodanese-like domain-containing protein [Mucilaginibacter rubeus]QTE47246.1 rhodanese-like domain-containing protein [Mucilaginibacter rubeus]QTE58639.1 rhodanese-like domain-containing protein [Mucilaginibacter rubeus]
MQLHRQIKASELLERLSKGESLNLLDVREVIEFHTYNIGGDNIPLSNLENTLNSLPYNKTDEIIVMCKVGLRSETAQNILERHGYNNVRNLSGGLVAVQKLK